MRNRVLMLSTVLLLGCGESVTAPATEATNAGPAQPPGGGMHDVALSGDEISITRVTEYDRSSGEAGGRPRRGQRTRVISLRSGEASVTAKDLPSPSARAQALAERGESPLPRLTAPSSARQANRGAWARTVPYLGRTDAVVQSEGVNDAPASDIRLVEDGRVTMRVQRTWRRGERSWLLESQRVEMPEAHFVETTKIRRAASAPSGLNASRLVATLGLASSGRIGVGGPLFDEGCDDSAFSADPCQAQKEAYESADEEVLLSGAAFIAGCAALTEIPLAGSYACVTLLGYFAHALKDRERADRALKACRDQQLLKRDCGQTIAFDPSTVDYGPGYGEGGLDLSGGSTAGSHECRVYFEYDLNTGDILYSEILSCW